ncbi:dethiobiotin synthase [Chitinophagaceae bacterium MMS25-I14]
MPAAIAIAGIHTGIGKTIAAAIITEALQADYWKPVQAGNLEDSDSITVGNLLTNETSVLHPEAVRLQMPASPHTAARHEGVVLDHHSFQLPQTENTLIVETAGGLFSPIDEKSTMADFISYNALPVILVTRHYLGSINHTLLCLEALQQRGIKVLGLLVSGTEDAASESFILNYYEKGLTIAHTGEIEKIDMENIRTAAGNIRPWLQKIIQHG